MFYLINLSQEKKCCLDVDLAEFVKQVLHTKIPSQMKMSLCKLLVSYLIDKCK